MKIVLVLALMLTCRTSSISAMIPQQPGLTYRQVSVVQDCRWNATPQASLTNLRITMFKELQAIPATSPAFAQFRLIIVNGTPVTVASPIGAAYVFKDVDVVTDFIFGIAPGEQTCTSWEFEFLKAMVALNNTQVDAVLTKYKVELVDPATLMRLFPR